MFSRILSTLLVLFVLLSCSKSGPDDRQLSSTPGNGGPSPLPPVPPAPPASSSTPEDTTTVPPYSILIDASRDGGAWWFPQTNSFSAHAPHQGKALADYLRSKEFTVHEVGRGESVTWSRMKKYSRVIRVGGYGHYNQQELAAYDSLLLSGRSLIYLNDHLAYHPVDALSLRLGLNFTGNHTGTLTGLAAHPVTTGVSSVPYIAGSVIAAPDPERITVLAWFGTGNAGAAMGILRHPSAKVFFMGDANSLEQVPQPFTSNLVNWIFH